MHAPRVHQHCQQLVEVAGAPLRVLRQVLAPIPVQVQVIVELVAVVDLSPILDHLNKGGRISWIPERIGVVGGAGRSGEHLSPKGQGPGSF